MHNPFIIGIAKDKDFCNRGKELKELKKYAINGQNVVFYSPRRYGKSSLIQKLLKQLKTENFLTVYIDLFSISSREDFISKLADGIMKGIGAGTNPRSFKDKLKNIFTHFIPSLEITPEGINISVKFDKNTKLELLLEDVLKGMYNFISKKNLRACIALDEFQEIVQLKESKEIEATLRSYIQLYKNVSFLFVGSRRQILQDIFTDKNRPFYKSAFLYQIEKISQADFTQYIITKFKNTGKECSIDIAEKIWIQTDGYPYYVQKLSYLLWDLTEKTCNDNLLKQAYKKLIEIETTDFEGIWNGLTLGQKNLLKCFAQEPTSTPFSKDYMRKYNLSAGGIQKAMTILISKDLIEKTKDGIYKLVDPIMAKWLCMS
ncbi:MAG: ATP-binding protein [Candidatus Omnitrophica bacterium]|nr:ATP-binding protein [Candidatus Omnitrophota bacterium]